MKIFEGSRRIAKVELAFWAGGLVAGSFLGGFDLTNKSDPKEFCVAVVGALVFYFPQLSCYQMISVT